MNYFTLAFCLLVSISGQSVANETIRNVRGVFITVLDEQETISNNWQNRSQKIVSNAMSLQGIKYKYGGSNPETGFDCSGLVHYVFRESANLNLPRTSRAISKVGKNIPRDALAPGDLVFFNTLRSPFSHVGIYIGNNNFIHAPRSGKTVSVANMNLKYWKMRFNGAQRLDQEVISAN
jgi:cell wall-associated NlpC family hydrolase